MGRSRPGRADRRRQRFPWLGLALSLGALGACGSSGQKAAAHPEGAGGSSLANPVVRCGPEESYRYVASEFRCPDGKNPLGGDLEAARRTRRGSEPHPENAHVIDIYRVACASGAAHVFVDMYGCEAYAKRLVGDAQSAELKELVRRYEAQEFDAVAEECSNASTKMPADEASECMTLLPASLVMLGRPEASIRFLGQLCSEMPEPSSLSDIRAHIVIRTVAFVDHARKGSAQPLDNEEGSRLLGAFATACELSGDDIQRYVQKHETL